MDFKKVLSILSKEFKKNDITYALIGGFALGLRGVIRATADIDMLISLDDITLAENILKKSAYHCVYKTENVSQFVSDLKPFGSIDFIHAFRPISLRMLDESEKISIFEGEIEIKVLQTEDIIGLKIQAIANNPDRAIIDRKDIMDLIQIHAMELDWAKTKEYFFLFNFKEWYAELLEEYGNKNT